MIKSRQKRIDKMRIQINNILRELEPTEFNELIVRATLANIALSFDHAFRFYDEEEDRRAENWKKKEKEKPGE